ncbi:hypothetical protein A2954_05975 [Candidatus Roizmanbacteria bacterium RIFCSPLOWO2_01_FULL_37_12]|uniref:DUF192 domain-containing protein n=1 Tax=Candidatus Roizmanbacteria bacterium RIFCSPLOWO2_01_FULL_37_12 TaxID=1802056 RepID=A0A1F7ICH2_9BACT|nr:MAG: hypothetical protein A3D76_01455 [Candidatus Roizmanbacteria bacterium RIFCSPHIGHO2_02_FULL_37_9b]OGK41054.1 MAG: hypothetical protein A2954_05975 [Candidatus Roizmanbacteria bacterium RIFCSPLOWO2_01_FULL_37_12]
MKKIILLLMVIIIGVFFVVGSKRVKESRDLQNKYKDFSIINYKLEGNNYKLLLADSSERWERGLMNFRSLEGVDGMIFIFPNKEIRNFWNKNTLMDLELLWIDGDKIVGRSELPSIEKSKEIVNVQSQKPVDKVIELPTLDKR